MCEHIKNIELYIEKINCMVCELYPNKTVLKGFIRV